VTHWPPRTATSVHGQVPFRMAIALSDTTTNKNPSVDPYMERDSVIGRFVCMRRPRLHVHDIGIHYANLHYLIMEGTIMYA
jgi:hypothetical protein